MSQDERQIMRFHHSHSSKTNPKKFSLNLAVFFALTLISAMGLEALAQSKTALRGSSITNKKSTTAKKTVVKKPVKPKTAIKKANQSKLDPDIAAALTPETLSPSTLEEPRGPYIEEAPKDDIARVAWCRGALEGHMELAKHVASITPYDEKLVTIGTSYTRAYDSALALSIEAQTDNGQAKILEARNLGKSHWDLAFQAQIKSAAWAYDTWQLPGDCEHAAVRISGRDHLFSEMATDEEIKVINDTLTHTGPTALSTNLPEPKIKAETAPTDPDAPVSSNTAQRVNRVAIPPNT